MAASTYGVNSGETAEYWFVTPYFTVNADKQFTFKATVNKYSETMSLKVFFLQMKDGKMERHEYLLLVSLLLVHINGQVI